MERLASAVFPDSYRYVYLLGDYADLLVSQVKGSGDSVIARTDGRLASDDMYESTAPQSSNAVQRLSPMQTSSYGRGSVAESEMLGRGVYIAPSGGSPCRGEGA